VNVIDLIANLNLTVCATPWLQTAAIWPYQLLTYFQIDDVMQTLSI